MKGIFQIASACLVMSAWTMAAKGPKPEPVCDVVCPDTFPIEENWHIPYTNDCTKFCHCANDGNWKKDCPPGLHFHRKLQVCDWPWDAGCESGAKPKPTDGPLVPSEPTLGPTWKPTSKPTSEPTSEPSEPKPVPGCENVTCLAEDCFEFPNSQDCQAYCDCDHGEISLKLCAEGLHYNPGTGNCDFPENTNCSIVRPPPIPGCEQVKCEGVDCFKTFNSLDCNAYCDCDHGNITVGHCSSGLHWNIASAACDFPEKAQCEGPNNSGEPNNSEDPSNSGEPNNSGEPDNSNSSEDLSKLSSEESGGDGSCDHICPTVWPIVDNNHLPIPGVCNQFCHCANDGNWRKDCPLGLHFNAKLQVCDWPHDAGCQ